MQVGLGTTKELLRFKDVNTVVFTTLELSIGLTIIKTCVKTGGFGNC